MYYYIVQLFQKVKSNAVETVSVMQTMKTTDIVYSASRASCQESSKTLCLSGKLGENLSNGREVVST